MSTTVDRIRGVAPNKAIKVAVKCATTTNIPLSGLSPVDGVALVEGDRVLVKNQSNAVDNGIWNASAGSWSRAIDFDGSQDVATGTAVFVNSGLVNEDLMFTVSTSDPVIGTSAINFAVVGTTTTSPISLGLNVRYEFDNMQAFLASTDSDYQLGEWAGLREEMCVLEFVGTSGGLVTNSATTPMHFNPVAGMDGIDIRTSGAISGTGTDYGSEINALLAYADSISEDIRIPTGTWRSDQTVRWKSCNISSKNGVILTPPSGTYGKFVYNSDGTTEYADNFYCANDFAGIDRIIMGRVKLLGASGLTDWTHASRELSNYNTAGAGGMTNTPANLTILGQLYIEGFGHPVFVPTQESAQATRGLTRWKGNIRSRFCCTPYGYFGGASNGIDDTQLFWRTDRCGGHSFDDPDNPGTDKEVLQSNIQKGSLNMGTYARGLFAEDGSDAEPGTVSYTSGSQTVNFTVAPAGVKANTWIVLEDAYLRPTDSSPINLVCKVQSVSGTQVTLYTGTHNLPNVNGSLKKWYIRPPRVYLNSASKLNLWHGYYEDQWDQIGMFDNSAIICPNFKVGGSTMSGRNGALINTAGMSGFIDITLEDTTNQTTQLEALVGVANIRDIATGVDSSYSITIKSQRRQDVVEPVIKLLKSIDPLEYFSNGRTSRYSNANVDNDIALRFADGTVYAFPQNGVIVERCKTRSGVPISGSVQVFSPARTGGTYFVKTLSQGANVDVVTFGTDAWPKSGKYVIEAGYATEINGRAEVHLFADAGGYHLETLYSNRFSLAMSGDTLQISDSAIVAPDTKNATISVKKTL